MSKLKIIRGLPGSGKSTKAKTDYPTFLHYEPDHLFCDTRGAYRYDYQLWGKACEWVQMMTDFALARGEDVVVSDVFARQEEIEPYRLIAKAHGAEIEIITCADQYGNCHKVPLTVINKMKADFSS